MGNEELLKQFSALLESSEKSNALIEAMSKEISNLKDQLETVNQKQDMFASHLNMIYKSKSIEETLDIMSNLGEVGMDVQDCDVYSFDAQENKLFTVNENNEREYTEISPDNPIGAALLKNEIYINNQYDGSPIGDDKITNALKNVAVIPLEAKSGDVLGVVVAKNKTDGIFDKSDIAKFDLEKGQIGSAFRIGLENKYLKQVAITDKLTHLPNRAGLQDYLKTKVLPELKDGKDTAVIMCDIDHFKNVNDTYGHDAGDKVLQNVAQTLTENMRESDCAFRWGGEEMIVIVNNTDAAAAYNFADRLRGIIEKTPCDIGDGKSINITMSMGVEQFNKNVKNLSANNIFDYFAENPLKAADNRLYEAKETGRNKVVADKSAMQKNQKLQEEKPSLLGNLRKLSAEDNKSSVKKSPNNRDNSL